MPETVVVGDRISRPVLKRRYRRSPRRSAKPPWLLTPEAFAKFLRWLATDREESGRKYERIRTRLVRFFAWRGCHNPEELFDKTIDRVCRKIELAALEPSGDALALCYAVATFVLQEYWREAKLTPIPENIGYLEVKDSEEKEREIQRLEECLTLLSQCDRDLITCYYDGMGRERIQRRKGLASTVGGMNALRVRVFRIRARLREWDSERNRDFLATASGVGTTPAQLPAAQTCSP
jgi:hypothetical protein